MEITDVSTHPRSCICRDCTEAFEFMVAKMKGVGREDICKQCQGTGQYYRQRNEFGFGICPQCHGSGLKSELNKT